MAEDRAALVARLRELEQTCEAQADAYEGDYLAWLERAEAAHHAIAALATPPETPSEGQNQMENTKKKPTEWRLARAVYDEHGLDVDRCVRALRRHGLTACVLERHASTLLAWAKRQANMELFGRVGDVGRPDETTIAPIEAPMIWQTGQSTANAGPHDLTDDDVVLLLDVQLSNGVRVRDARRADLIAHAERLERQAGTMLQHARIARVLADRLADDDETVAASIARRAVA